MEKHVKALTDFPPPSDLKQLQRFLGLINFYVYFIDLVDKNRTQIATSVKVFVLLKAISLIEDPVENG